MITTALSKQWTDSKRFSADSTGPLYKRGLFLIKEFTVERFMIHPDNPQTRYIEQAAAVMKHDGICIYPTDTVYGMGCAVSNAKAIDRIGTLLDKDRSRLFSFLCSDFSQMSRYVVMENHIYNLMKHYLPGPFTFILPATNFVPKKVCPKRKTVGVRIPSNIVTQELIKALGEPIANTSLPLPGQLRGDPESFDKSLLNQIDIMLDIGPLDGAEGSTIVDCTQGTPEVIRQGKGIFNEH